MSCIIIGASHAGVQAAVNLRTQGYEGDITLISAENVLPYQRPPLSKAFLQNTLPEQRLWLRPEAFYQQKNITLRLGKRVTEINRELKTLSLNDGKNLHYDKLIIATGASVRRLTVPGSDLPNIHYLRDYKDTVGIRDSLDNVKRVVVIGGGYIGLEAAASMKKLGKEVTLLVNSERPLSKVTSPVISDYLTALHTKQEVIIETNTQVESITSENDTLTINTSNGKAFNADMVIVGIGVTPNQQLAEHCGLQVENGVCVNEHMQTSDESIYAIGDCTNFFHPVYKKHLRIESVQNATDQSKTAALAICGQPSPYNAPPWFWSDQFDAKLQIAGLSHGYDEVVVRQESEKSLAVFYLSNGHLIAVDTIDQPRTFMATRKYIHSLPIVEKTKLANINQSIKDTFNELSGVE